jgi:hypothetical protein
MSIAWATVVIVVLLLPGFVFFWGFYAPHQVTRESVPASPLGQLAGVVILGFFVHVIAYALINSAWVCRAGSGFLGAVPCIDFDQLAALLRADGVAPAGRQPRTLNAMLDDSAPWVLVYFVVVALLTFAVGFGAGRMVGSGLLPLARHRYLFMLEEGRRHDGSSGRADRAAARLVRAHVLSKTTNDGLVLIYDGILQDFYAKADGTISYIVLRGARCGCIKIDAAQTRRAGQTTALDGVDAGDATTALLMLTSEDIANVYFEPLSAVTKSPAEEQRLAEAIKAFEDIGRPATQESRDDIDG